MLGHSFIHDSDLEGIFTVVVGEAAATNDGDTKGVEESGQDGINGRERASISRGFICPSGKMVRPSPPPTGKLEATVADCTPGAVAARSAAAR